MGTYTKKRIYFCGLRDRYLWVAQCVGNKKSRPKGRFFLLAVFQSGNFVLLKRFKFGSEDEVCWWKLGAEKAYEYWGDFEFKIDKAGLMI